MLKTVTLKPKRFDNYQEIIGAKLYTEVKELAKQLKGKRILHINSIAHGGGVDEILRSEVALLRDLGLKADWKVLNASPEFFATTKRIHDGLQGDESKISESQWSLYLSVNRQIAKDLADAPYDYIFIHDPQPAAALSFLSENQKSKWIWRCHIDSKHATRDLTAKFSELLRPYDGLIYTLKKYAIPGLEHKNTAIIPVAIDPLSSKNQKLSAKVCQQIVASFGIDTSKPLAVQISRFDQWKDPLGVIMAWKLAQQEIPNLQLALVGALPADTPRDAAHMLQAINEATAGHKDVFIIAGRAYAHEVHAFQTQANVVIQKSLREGFGLTVTEALWAGTPVVGSNIGGIPEQIKHGKSGYLVKNVEETAKYMVELVNNPAKAKAMGKYGHDYVKEHFLMPRLICDDLKFIRSLS